MTDTPIEVTVTYGLTQKTVDYSNARMDITVRASAPNTDAARTLVDVLTVQASSVVQEAVDQVLEANDLPAVYSDQPRYDVLTWSFQFDIPTVYVLVPHDAWPTPPWPQSQSYSVRRRGIRLAAARAYLADKQGAQSIDCADGDLTAAQTVLATAEQAQTDARAAQEAQREAERESRQGKAIPALEQALTAMQFLSFADMDHTPEAAKERAKALLARLAARVGALRSAPDDDEDDDEDHEEGDDGTLAY